MKTKRSPRGKFQHSPHEKVKKNLITAITKNGTAYLFSTKETIACSVAENPANLCSSPYLEVYE
jgi:hypothetical protein